MFSRNAHSAKRVAAHMVNQSGKIGPSTMQRMANSRSAALVIPKRKFATEVIAGVPHLIQTTIDGLHVASGLPWWATLGVSTVFVRMSLLPLVRYQILASRKLAAAMPEINFLYQLLLQRLQGIDKSRTGERLRILGIFIKGVNACMKLHRISITEIVAYPFVNFTIFVTFIVSLRDMVTNADQYDMMEGGLFWFQNLSEEDKTFFLPISAVTCSYLGLELGFSATTGRFLLILKDFAQSLLMLALPSLCGLPAGVFCYWIPSSLFGILQTRALRDPRVLRMMKIPPPTVPPHLRSR